MKKQYGRQLEETIELAAKLYVFRAIVKEGYEVSELEHAKDCDYFEKADGTYLRGYCVHTTLNLIENTAEKGLSFSKEIYLMDNGTLQKFYTITETPFCDKCKKFHTYIHREFAEDQTLSDDELNEIEEFIIGSLSFYKEHLI